MNTFALSKHNELYSLLFALNNLARINGYCIGKRT